MRPFLILLLFATRLPAAVLFDSVNDMIGFGTCGDTMLKEDAACTISAWINPLTMGEANNGTIVRRGSIQFRLNSGDEITFRVAGSAAVFNTSVASSIVTNFWSHVLVTWDGTTNFSAIHLYVNGVEVSYGANANGASLTDNATDTVIIGNNPGASITFNGYVSDVAVWDSVLSAANISQLFKGKLHYMPLQISPSTLKAYWPLDDFADGVTLSGTDTVKDRSGSAFHGSQTNGPVAKASQIVSYP